MTEEKVLSGVLDKLEKLNVSYALTGALAATGAWLGDGMGGSPSGGTRKRMGTGAR